jgi:hypothetical protein
MKKLSFLLPLLLAACASTNTQNLPAASSRLGTITDKHTIVTQSRHALPIDVGVGLGGSGWGVNLGLGRLLGLGQTSSSVFQYTIKLNPNESLTLQSEQDFNVGTCLTA